MPTRHLARCFVAGIVAVLPVGGTVLGIVYLEISLAGSWLAEQAFYFPGLGLLLAVAGLYLVGLLVTTVLGRWVWGGVEGLLGRLPALGTLYRTLKQILGYGSGRDAVFQGVVLVPSTDTGGVQLGLLTGRLEEGDASRCVVFVPGAPNPTTGRLIVVDTDRVTPSRMEVADVFRSLVAVGKTGLSADLGARA